MGAAEVVDRDADIVEPQLGGDLADAERVEQHVALADLDDETGENSASSATRCG